ncbi:MAG: response regulator [Acidimicrobiia bacterium]|nr:response regulator [Acidimicrobiia bacterium]
MDLDVEATILVIEDQEFTERVIRAALRDRPFEVFAASNGEDGYDMLKHLRPDLLLLDLSLPGKDGWEVLEDMRRDPDLMSIPVIIVSAQGRSAVEARAADLDISALINKPFRVPELRQAVDMVLGAAEVA